ncbi:FixH family protein [Paraliomyxa miuraensis]|uniref:FixH family protein n=1 Tax=Paraliomyxa miuraensis TaxID=376150 RepID=UPI00225B2873|nr:FixH family protein [Paraliomyxa miuraensis]MCX4246403.1 FixH family protein [Paraliomyxa miuraensis]
MRSRGMALLVTMLALGGCDGDDGTSDDSSEPRTCAEEDRAEAFTVGTSQTGDLHTVSIVEADPAEPIRGDNMWTVMVTDPDGAAMEGATIGFKPWMPDHGHGTPVEAEITELGAGEYEATPVNLFMAGYWEVTLDVTDASGASDSVVFKVCVE